MQKSAYYTPAPSPWPIAISFSAAFTAASGTAFIHEVHFSLASLVLGLLLVLGCFSGWMSDLIKESVKDNSVNETIKRGMKIGMISLIASEAMLFVAFFWSFFKSWLSPVAVLDSLSVVGKLSWPPAGIHTLDAWGIPLMNTFILLLSGATVSWSYKSLMLGDRKKSLMMLFITIALGLTFTLFQGIEYYHASFPFRIEGPGSIYASNFYMATGFHGAHVIVGTIFLAVCWFRTYKDKASEKHTLGFEFAVWYWHFVDVVWLLLFAFLYVAAS